MKVQLMLDRKQYNSKPNREEAIKLQKKLKQDEVTIENLAKLLSSGCTFKPALLNGTKNEDWLSQQVFALDFDEGTTIERELKQCRFIHCIEPAFGYTSFSHTEQKHKFRLVFVTDEVITDVTKRNKLQLALLNVFKRSDQCAKDATRIFFGGKQLIHEDYTARINADSIIKEFYKEKDLVKQKAVVKQKPMEQKPVEQKLIKNEFDREENILALKKKDIGFLQKKLNITKKRVFINNTEFYKYIITEIDLKQLIGEKSNSFKCIFHDDKNPSANIFVNEDGHQIYKCHSGKCGKCFNIIGLIRTLCKMSKHEAYDFIKELFMLEIERSTLKDNIRQILSNELKEKIPLAMKNCRNMTMLLEILHDIAIENGIEHEENIIFFASLEYLCQLLEKNPNNKGRISQRLTVLAYHKLIVKLDDSEIPKKLSNKSKHISAKRKAEKTISWFGIPTKYDYEAIELRAIAWKENKYSMNGVSREMFVRAEGLIVANELYPQFKYVLEDEKVVDRTTTKESDERVEHIIKVAEYLVKKKGYTTEKDICELLKKKESLEVTKLQFKKAMKQILEFGNFKMVTANKEIKKKYKIKAKSKSYPKIIMKNE